MNILETLPLIFLLYNPEVNGEIERLGHSKFRVREMASQELEGLGSKSILALNYAKLSGDLEVSRRAERILDRYYNHLPFTYENIPYIDRINEKSPCFHFAFNKLKKSYDYMPETKKYCWHNASYWLRYQDCGRNKYLTTKDFYTKLAYEELKKINAYGYKSKDEFIRYRIATHLFAKDLIKWGISKKEVLKILYETK